MEDHGSGRVKFSLGKKITIMIVLMAVTLGVFAVVLSYDTYKNTMDSEYETIGSHLIETALSQTSPEEIKHYLTTLVKDERYHEYQQFLVDLKKANEVTYIYILFLGQDHGTYIFDSDEGESACELGYEEPYEPTYQMMSDHFVKGEEVDPLITKGEYGWLMTILKPVYTSGGELVAYACVDISMNKVMEERRNFLILLSVVLACVTLFFCVLYLIFTRRSLLLPINKLSKATSEFVDTDVLQLDEQNSTISQIQVRTGDEIEQLSLSIKKMEQDIYRYIHNLTAVTAEKERIGAELDVARQIQASMLPCIFPAFPERAEFDIYATMQPAKEVGGDFYDFFLVDENHLAFVMADVSGKGVPAALFMVITKTLLKNHAQSNKNLENVFSRVNDQLFENNDAGMFVTVWMGVLEISTGICSCINAGHNFPLFMKKGEEFEYLETESNLVLAAMDGMDYVQFEIRMEPGDVIYLYTDGLTEAINSENELYGEERLKAVLNRCRDQEPQELLGQVREDLEEFVKDAAQFDDITMLALKLR